MSPERSEWDYISWEETIRLLRSPANARRLVESIAEAETAVAADLPGNSPQSLGSCRRES
ncbi:hypothetical protein [Streptomyces marispadix]|uniref:Uncharacterized protein n=1 Tax=Streptomyces marispadix TaxID=2922868 RepID=A0ABS9SUF0_9ACTN|nr:hypothetical protein [Streptomyces marispadix]MCH6159914.1 hypothetical protein [Streptomyces marispadix]